MSNSGTVRSNPFGPTGRDVTVIGQGTWYIDQGDRGRAAAALRRGIDLGMTHIDTAEMYGDAELVVADAIAGRRDEVFLVSKVLPENASRRGVAAVRVEPQLFSYVAALARRTRDWPALTLGASPRAAINLLQMAKARAALDGRDYLLPDDVKAAAPAVLRHRLVLKPEADLEGLAADQVVGDVLAAVDVPK